MVRALYKVQGEGGEGGGGARPARGGAAQRGARRGDRRDAPHGRAARGAFNGLPSKHHLMVRALYKAPFNGARIIRIKHH